MLEEVLFLTPEWMETELVNRVAYSITAPPPTRARAGGPRAGQGGPELVLDGLLEPLVAELREGPLGGSGGMGAKGTTRVGGGRCSGV